MAQTYPDVAAKSMAARRILAVFNPAAGRSRRNRFNDVVEKLKNLGCAVTVIETKAPGHAEKIAQDASSTEFDIIAAAGGDGTINEVVNGLKGKAISLGIIPLGTANVVADEIGLKKNPNKVANALAHGTLKKIRVGVANGRRFVMMAGSGFDANVVDGVSLRLKKKLGPLAYVWQATTQSFKDKCEPCSIVIDGTAHATVSMVACNGRRYGGPFIAAPTASLSDDSFEVVLMKGRGWFSVARYGLGLILGRITMWPDVEVIRGRQLAIENGNGEPVQADGDIITRLPVHISIDPEPVWLVYPAL